MVKSAVSFRQYGEPRGRGMPCRMRVVVRDRRLRLEAESSGGIIDGSPLSSQISLDAVCKRALARWNDEPPAQLWFKISGDGAQCRKSTYLNITVELIHPQPVKRSVVVLAYIKGDESAENPDLVAVLSQLDNELRELYEVGGTHARFYLGADLKFLWMAFGMAGGFSDFPCPYCTVHKKKKTGNTWSAAGLAPLTAW